MESESIPTAAEQDIRLEPWKRIAGLIAGPLAAGLLYLAPLPELPPAAHILAAILVWVVLYWIMEPIPLPVTALLGTAACVLVGLGTAKSIFASYAHPIIFLFLGSFFLAKAMTVHGVDRRFAFWMLSLPWIAARPARMLLALGTVTAVISMWISNTAAAALMLPVALGICGALRDSGPAGQGDYRIALMLILSYAATAGGMATIIGTPPNLIGVGLIAQQADVRISFLTWMMVGFPLTILMLLICWALLRWVYPPPMPVLPNLAGYLRIQRVVLGPWTRGQGNACLAFGAALLFWIGPGLIAAIQGPDSPLSVWLETHLPNELVALLAAGLLFVLPASSGAPTLSWKQAAAINWGTILLFGAGLAFGDLMIKTGLAETIGRGFVTWAGTNTVWSLTAVSIGVAVIVSELTSNTATASMLVPLAIAIAQSAGVSPVPPALGACLGASLGFALPVSTPPNAIVYGTGLVPIRSMVRIGLLTDLLGALLIWLTLRLLCPLLGLST
ncbi:MAG TPA: DASS family sodium-coupled anion symporter [Nitrospiraceae bacterium]|nr:DASS family sodium-coupled anion symporter [Nitrospiraceae bacterium]